MLSFCDGFDFGFEFEVDPCFSHFSRNKAAHVFVKTRQDFVAPMDLRHVRAQAVEDRRKLARDVTTAHHQQPFGEGLQVKHTVRSHHVLVALNCGDQGRAASRNQNIFGRILFVANLHGVRIHQSGPALDNFDFCAAQKLVINAVEPFDLFGAIGF